MLKNIVIRNVATFNSQGITIGDLRRINFIYGNNGSGKTTIANFLAAKSRAEGEKYVDCSVEWADEEREDILVFNRDFREKNIVNAMGLPGVFTLGSDNIIAMNEIKEQNKKYDDKTKESIGYERSKGNLVNEKNQLKKDLSEKLWATIYKKNEQYGEIFSGYKTKAKFCQKILDTIDNLDPKEDVTNLLSDDEMKAMYSEIFSTDNLIEIPPIAIRDNIEEFLHIISNEIWETKIIGKQDIDLGNLINALGNGDWVYTGRQYLRDGSDVCPFCQEHTISQSFRLKLENYFDKTFTSNIQMLKDCAEAYNQFSKTFIEECMQICGERKDVMNFLNVSAIEEHVRRLQSTHDNNLLQISNKLKEPSRSITLKSFNDDFNMIKELVDEANQKLLRHNDMVRNYESKKKELINKIWMKVALSAKNDVDEYKRSWDGKQIGISKLEHEIKRCDEEKRLIRKKIESLTNGITNITYTIDKINETLRVLGFDNFSIVESTEESEYYRIQRANGTLATTTLSEGELTFISFLYFLQLVEGATDKDKITNYRILVIDDPISSLDSSSLFVVSTMLKEIFKKLRNDASYKEGKIKQVLLLTHNVYFHKEVTFIDGKSSGYKDVYYWILRKNKQVSQIECYKTDNPIHSSYELLWNELMKSKDNNDGVSTQNIMRRILETYFRVFGGYDDKKILDMIKKEDDKEIVRSLMVWSNQGSHDVFDDLDVEHPSTMIGKYHDVFKHIFEDLGHMEHYNMMMKENNDAS